MQQFKYIGKLDILSLQYNVSFRYPYYRTTPPDSPGQLHYEGIIPEIDIYAVPSCDGKVSFICVSLYF